MKKKNKNDNLIIYGILLSIPLSIYPLFTDNITMGDLTLLITLLISFFKTKYSDNKLKFYFPIIFYIFMLLLLSLLQFMIGAKGISDGVFSLLRYMFYLFVCLTIPKNGFDSKRAYNIYKVISLFIAIYVILQFISYNFFRIILPINILGLRTYDRVYLIDSISSYLTQGKFYRPSGIFIEPAHYASYQAPILYMLFNSVYGYKKTDKYISYIIMLSIFMTGSTAGIIIIAYCFIKPIFNSFKKSFIKTFGLLFMLFASFLLFFSTNYGQSIYERTFSDSSNGAINGRFGNVTYVFENNNHKIIGNGLSSNEVYLPSYPYLFLCYGIVGVIVFVFLIFRTYISCNSLGRGILGMFVFVCIGTLSLFGTSIVIYFSFIYSNLIERNSEDNLNKNLLLKGV